MSESSEVVAGVDAKKFNMLVSMLGKEELAAFATRALADLAKQDADRHLGWKISFYVLLVLSAAAGILALALSIAAGFKLHDVDMEVVRWTWLATFGGGAGSAFSGIQRGKKAGGT